jgi:Predicted membrane protein
MGACNEYTLDHHNRICGRLIAKFLHPGNKNEPSGFILTTLLGIAGAFVATYLGQALGWYKAGEGAGFIGAIVGAIIVLVVWGIFANRRGQGV